MEPDQKEKTRLAIEKKMRRLAFAREQRQKYPEKPGIHPSVIVPDWVEIGENVIIHENVTLGTQGFGFVREDDGKWYHIPHVGKLIIEDNVEIFAGTNIDRGTVDPMVIGKGTKIDHNCHIAHNCQIGNNCVIAAGVVFAGSVKLGESVWVGPNSTLMNGITIGDNVYIGTQSNVLKDVEKNAVIAGNPARILRIGDQPHLL